MNNNTESVNKIEINKKDFTTIMRFEMDIKGKKMVGENHEQRKANLKYFLERYYAILSYLNERELKHAFAECSKYYASFPHPNQLMKHASRQPLVRKNPEIPKAIPVTPKIQKTINKTKNKTDYRVDEAMMQASKNMIRQRWRGENLDAVFERMDFINSQREERPENA